MSVYYRKSIVSQLIEEIFELCWSLHAGWGAEPVFLGIMVEAFFHMLEYKIKFSFFWGEETISCSGVSVSRHKCFSTSSSNHNTIAGIDFSDGYNNCFSPDTEHIPNLCCRTSAIASTVGRIYLFLKSLTSLVSKPMFADFLTTVLASDPLACRVAGSNHSKTTSVGSHPFASALLLDSSGRGKLICPSDTP